MRFEFDPAKSASNLAKHGIDFATAQELWGDENYLEFQALERNGEIVEQVLNEVRRIRVEKGLAV